MKTCEEAQELISRLLDGDLSDEEQRDVQQHLATCPDCQAVYRAFRSLSETIGEDLDEPPARLHTTVMADVRREALRRRQAPGPLRAWLAIAACAALVLLGVTRLPRMGASAPMLAASQAAPEAAMVEEAEPPVAYEAEADLETPAEAAGAPDAGSAARAADALPAPLPEPSPAAQETLPDVTSPARDSLWSLALIALPLIAAAALLLLRGKKRR